ncbi:iron-containing alcohol dehydrogenase [Paenibacillus caseinilyticus]|uniref:iron-containing alcohol dehydrogenase n=1 Tax=Paenibacillus caseinilyticus TaxID=3098138 RepID=UPI0022B8FE97|nr:iron-containing alcohol dehydrogenase [Paenibacillus caseinilyticus]MCZ8519549.1 iron-containing alcohol dehydrogenase [Paenibacillus caseinilyticus]
MTIEKAALYGFRTAGSILAGRHALEQLPEKVREVGQFRRAAVIAQPSILAQGTVDRVMTGLREVGIPSFCTTEVQPEPTAENIREVFGRISAERPDLMIGIGGGSVLDAAKLFSVLLTDPVEVETLIGIDRVARPGLPTVLIPTTSGTGSEVTPNAIVTLPEQELKVGIISRHLLPALVILDPVLTISLPPHITAATGMDAFTHAFESLISNKANPLSDMFAMESMRLIAGSLLQAYRDGGDLDARENMLLGSMYGGMALTAAGTAAVHALAYPLGGKFGIPHGVANSMLLPHVTAYNRDAIGARLLLAAQAMGLSGPQMTEEEAGDRVIGTLLEWTRELGIPQSLRTYGVSEEDVEALTTAALQVTRLLANNPKAVDAEAVSGLYRKLLP